MSPYAKFEKCCKWFLKKEVSSIVNARRTATDEDKHPGDLKRKANSLYNI